MVLANCPFIQSTDRLNGGHTLRPTGATSRRTDGPMEDTVRFSAVKRVLQSVCAIDGLFGAVIVEFVGVQVTYLCDSGSQSQV